MTMVLKYGVGYELVVKQVAEPLTQLLEPPRVRLQLGIRCHTCKLTSYHPKDVQERYCACCHRFHETGDGEAFVLPAQ